MAQFKKNNVITALNATIEKTLDKYNSEVEELKRSLAGYENELSTAENDMDVYMAAADKDHYIEAKRRAAAANENIDWINARLGIINHALITEDEAAKMIQPVHELQDKTAAEAREKALELIKQAYDILADANDIIREGNEVIARVNDELLKDHTPLKDRSGAPEANRLPFISQHLGLCLNA